MRDIFIGTSRGYHVYVGENLFSQTAHLVKQAIPEAKTIAIISDSNVWPLYGEKLVKVFSSGYRVLSHVIPAGEESKNGKNFLNLLSFLAANQVTRTDCLIALGGGVVGDLTGFTAASYLRGIPYVQIPTSLLACVDSSVGGKTAIDLPEGKNLAGAFYQPSLVICDTDVLSTLPIEIFRDGCAEIIKYAILFDKALFSELKQDGLGFHRESVITRCVELKRDVVSEDECDRGLRQKLNLGHTIGHGVEAKSQFSLSHGKSVAIGTAIITRSSLKKGYCSEDTANEILSLLQQFGLPTETGFSAESLYHAALSDKKRNGSSINLIIPREIGKCTIESVPVSELKNWIEVGL